LHLKLRNGHFFSGTKIGEERNINEFYCSVRGANAEKTRDSILVAG